MNNFSARPFSTCCSTPSKPSMAPAKSRSLWKNARSEEHTSELQSPYDLVCRLLLEKKKNHHSSARLLIFTLYLFPHLNLTARTTTFLWCRFLPASLMSSETCYQNDICFRIPAPSPP